ncbi:hypothetical protein VNO78_32731 [Psophocarpus tetragonolobus]|uniref:Uncharacterized protein n=1 Tax=Psophocarpus tetragonolobus TaxID=3891 RepID=A0AAN9RP79_PSOTE
MVTAASIDSVMWPNLSFLNMMLINNCLAHLKVFFILCRETLLLSLRKVAHPLGVVHVECDQQLDSGFNYLRAMEPPNPVGDGYYCIHNRVIHLEVNILQHQRVVRSTSKFLFKANGRKYKTSQIQLLNVTSIAYLSTALRQGYPLNTKTTNRAQILKARLLPQT